MAEMMGSAPNHHLLYSKSLFPELNPHSILRGPMYSAYAERREWKLRTKKAGINPPSIPTPTKRASPSSPMVSRLAQDFSMAFRKENKKPPSMTPLPPMAPKPELRRAGSTSANRGEERRGSSGGGGNGVFSMRKSYSCLKELKEYAVVAVSAIDEERRRGRNGSKEMLRKSVGSHRRQTSSATATWMG